MLCSNIYLSHLLSVDFSKAWSKLSPLPWAQGASGAVGLVYTGCHAALHQGVMSTGGCTRHVLQATKGHKQFSICVIQKNFHG